jgi:hypothetical protein
LRTDAIHRVRDAPEEVKAAELRRAGERE